MQLYYFHSSKLLTQFAICFSLTIEMHSARTRYPVSNPEATSTVFLSQR
eukprot:UN11489